MHFRAWTAAALLFCCALPAHAQQAVKLQFTAGQVSLSAQNAPIRTILAEWARLGGVTIVNGDRVAGAPVTLELSGVSERQALDIVLRNVAGYMLAPRPATSRGVSAYDRIVILPTSVAPRNPPPPANAGVVAPRPVLPRPPALVRPPDPNGDIAIDNGPDGDAADDVPDPTPVQQVPSPQVPRPGPPGLIGRPGAIPVPRVATPASGVLIATPQEEPETTTPAGTPPTATNPFGIPLGSSTMPGVISPVPAPQQQQPQQQNQPNRVQ